MLIGRKYEQQQLLQLLRNNQSDFVAVYGRRRVGKTYLIRETFQEHFAFRHTGIQKATKEIQLKEFSKSLRMAGMQNVPKIRDWFDAFSALGEHLSALPAGKKVVFIDELPWLDTPKSNVVSALEHFWNSWAAYRDDILLIVCGSATSWIIKKIIKNYGGLHDRLTKRLVLQPFSLRECELYAQVMGLGYTRRQILETYMVLGGIPYYWSLLHKTDSWAQAIDNLFFAPNAELQDEFESLYYSLFRNPTMHIDVVTALGKKKAGMTRSEIVEVLGQDHGGTLSTVLSELEQCGFIRTYYSIGKSKKDALYQLIDHFTLFHFKFIRENRNHDEHFWTRSISKPIYSAWSGLAFERVCLWHLPQIKQALGISGIISNAYSWTYRPKSKEEKGTQIDMLIDRDDDVIDLCEMKFSPTPFTISKQYDEELQLKRCIFITQSATRKAVRLVMITSNGLTPNPYAGNIMSVITMDDLFE